MLGGFCSPEPSLALSSWGYHPRKQGSEAMPGGVLPLGVAVVRCC